MKIVTMARDRTSVLFVCLGNICRSPLAECVFRHLTRERGVEHLFEVDSAGTSGWHDGDPPDSRSVATARARGVEVAGRSRKIRGEDLERFDYVIAMDSENLANILRLQDSIGGGARVHLLREWDPGADTMDVPDPYYERTRGFEDVQDIVERSCAALLDHLMSQRRNAALVDTHGREHRLEQFEPGGESADRPVEDDRRPATDSRRPG